ncbi:MAG TPA: hypothetical protein VD815_05195 [Candidatus Saccharimonadales bacterium]|nr:hypothetical protein [Candidatus Saccharimonadales bacterium]
MTDEQTKVHYIINTISKARFRLLILSLLTSFGPVILIDLLDGKEALGQHTVMDNEPLRINVQVTNSGDISEIGSIHIVADETGISKNSNDVSFASGQTIIQLFEFSLNEIPTGTGFSVEVVYGDDHSKRIHGINSQTSEPEIIDIVIP